MFTRYLLVVLLVVSSEVLPAQERDKKISLGLEGMVGVSVGKNFWAVNVGGPSFQLLLNKNLKAGVGALPSFYVHKGRAGARLGVAPRIDYRNVVFFVPFFHRDNANEWIWSVGLGYKFHKK